MKMHIYHGSEQTVVRPSLEFSHKMNDYGVGFYCTDDLELAKEWACRRDTDGFANEYYLNANNLNLLDLTEDNDSVLQWIAILLQNRQFKTDNAFADSTRSYVVERFAPKMDAVDIIKGYRADDSYFQYAEAFIENRLSLRMLSKALRLGKLGTQIALISQRSLDGLEFNGADAVSKIEYYPKFVNRDNKARRDYKNMLDSFKLRKTDVFLYDIIREEMDIDDPRIQRSLSK